MDYFLVKKRTTDIDPASAMRILQFEWLLKDIMLARALMGAFSRLTYILFCIKKNKIMFLFLIFFHIPNTSI